MWQFSDVSFAAVAETMGATGIRVVKPAVGKKMLEQKLRGQGAYVVDVSSDIDAIALWICGRLNRESCNQRAIKTMKPKNGIRKVASKSMISPAWIFSSRRTAILFPRFAVTRGRPP